MSFKKMMIIISITFSLIIVCLLGSSYAYYSLSNAATEFSATTNNNDISIIYAQSSFVNVETGIPITAAEAPTKAGKSNFTALPGANLTGYNVNIEISLTEIVIDPNLRNADFKVQLLENGTMIRSISGSDIGTNTSYILKPMSRINVGTTYNYELRVWINDNNTSQNPMMGKSFQGRIQISSAIKK